MKILSTYFLSSKLFCSPCKWHTKKLSKRSTENYFRRLSTSKIMTRCEGKR